MGRIGFEQVVEGVLEGAAESYWEYKDWSTVGLEEAPEYFITVNIGKRLFKLEGGKFLTLEDRVARFWRVAGGKEELGREVRPNGKADLVLWWGRRKGFSTGWKRWRGRWSNFSISRAPNWR